MDDDRPIQPDRDPARPHGPLERARAGDPDAFLELVRPRAARLLRLASLAAGDPSTGSRAAAAATRTAWSDLRRIRSDGDLDRRLEAALATLLPRRFPGSDASLDRALAGLAPAERLALARCLDASPDAAALAVAGRAGVEVVVAEAAWGAMVRGSTIANHARGAPPVAPGAEIVDLDGPLAGWDLPRLRTALVAAAGPVDVERFVDGLRPELTASRPARRWVAELRGLQPSTAGAARGLAFVLVALVGAGTLAWTASGPEAGGRTEPRTDVTAGDAGEAGPASAPPAPPAGTSRGPTGGGGTIAGSDLDTPGDFPAEVDGLAVIGVRAARGMLGDPATVGRDFAIRGWMTAPQLLGPCISPPPSSDLEGAPAPDRVAIDDPTSRAADFCRRVTTLREAPVTDWGVAHLHPQLLPGTGFGGARRAFAAGGGEPIPVVVIAHHRDAPAASCVPGGRHCGEEIVVDRIAWALGEPLRKPVAIHPAASGADLLRSPSEALAAAEQAYGSLKAVSVAAVPAPELGIIEPDAAGVAPSSGFAWLVRAVVEPRPSHPAGAARTWLVVEDRTGRVIAAPGAVAGTDGVRGGGFLFPRRVDGALVHSVGEANALAATGRVWRGPRPIASNPRAAGLLPIG